MARLRDLIARLEQTPRSPKRDVLLLAVRDRVVMLDTGVGEPSVWGYKTEDGEQQQPSAWFR
jgi:hypothetical protein